MEKLFENRPYQNRIHKKSIEYLSKPNNGITKTILIESPTGSGKTVMSMRLAKYLEEQGHKVGIIAHRRELLDQAVQTNNDFFKLKDLVPISMFTRTPEQYNDRTVIIVDECLPADAMVVVIENDEIVQTTIGEVVNNGKGSKILSVGDEGLEFNFILNRSPMGRKEIYEVIVESSEGEFVLPITAEGRVFADGEFRKVRDLQPGQEVSIMASCWQEHAKTTHYERQKQILKTPSREGTIIIAGTNYQRDNIGRRMHRVYEKTGRCLHGQDTAKTQHSASDSINGIQIGFLKEVRKTSRFTETYDIGVDKVHNFFADGILVHNCQHDASKSASILHDIIRPKIIIGLTATPYRTDKANLCFQKIIKDAGIHQLIREGFLAKFNQFVYDQEWSPQNISQLYLSNPAKWGKTVIYFLTTDAAVECAKLLQNNGVAADYVIGSEPRDKILKDFKEGKLDVLTNVAVLTEGFDYPALKSAFVRPSSKGPTVQMAGRVFRKYPGLPIVNIIQNQDTKYPFTKHATAHGQFIMINSKWCSIDPKNLNPVFAAQRKRIAAAKICMPDFLKNKSKNGFMAIE